MTGELCPDPGNSTRWTCELDQGIATLQSANTPKPFGPRNRVHSVVGGSARPWDGIDATRASEITLKETSDDERNFFFTTKLWEELVDIVGNDGRPKTIGSKKGRSRYYTTPLRRKSAAHTRRLRSGKKNGRYAYLPLSQSNFEVSPTLSAKGGNNPAFWPSCETLPPLGTSDLGDLNSRVALELELSVEGILQEYST
jgi:hypothetical protein